MTPMKPHRPYRSIRTFDLITPEGRLHRFPESTWTRRIAMMARSYTEPAILLAVVLILAYSAGVLANAMQPLAADACPDLLRLQRDA